MTTAGHLQTSEAGCASKAMSVGDFVTFHYLLAREPKTASQSADVRASPPPRDLLHRREKCPSPATPEASPGAAHKGVSAPLKGEATRTWAAFWQPRDLRISRQRRTLLRQPRTHLSLAKAGSLEVRVHRWQGTGASQMG